MSMSTESVMPSNHLILCRPILLPSIFLSIRVFSNESLLHMRWPKYWSFSFIISPSNEYLGLIYISTAWSPCSSRNCEESSPSPQFKSINFRLSAFSVVQLSHPYMTTGKTIALRRRTFVGKVMSLLFNMLSATATAKSLQSCPTLCNPIDSSPPGSPIPGISLEGMMLKLKLQYFGHLMRRSDSLEKTLMLGGIGGRRRG